MRIYEDGNNRPAFDASLSLQSYLGHSFAELVVRPDEYPGLVNDEDSF